MIRPLPKIEKRASQTTKHLCIFDDGVIIACVREHIGQMVSDLIEAGLDIERGVPGSAIRSVEPVQAFCRQAGDVGVVSGVTIPMQAGFGRTAMLSLMTDQQTEPQFSARALQKVVAAVAYMHLHLSQPDAKALRILHQSLTPRELTCLQWMSLGKKKSEIAEIHNLSEKTVRFHLDNAKMKLNAANAPHMVRLALEGGMIAFR